MCLSNRTARDVDGTVSTPPPNYFDPRTGLSRLALESPEWTDSGFRIGRDLKGDAFWM